MTGERLKIRPLSFRLEYQASSTEEHEARDEREKSVNLFDDYFVK
jgi:hypothetical protein